MVKASAIATFGELDLKPGLPLTRRVERLAARGAGNDAGVRHAFDREPTQWISWTFVYEIASMLDLQRLADIWRVSQRGCLPILATPPGAESAIPVEIVDPDLQRVIQNAKIGRFEITVREWRA